MHNPEGKSEEARKLKNNLKGTCILVYMTLRANRIGKAVPRRTTTTRHQVGGAIRGYISLYVVYMLITGVLNVMEWVSSGKWERP